MTADAEFLLSKAKYKAITGREQRRDADVLCYQIRQSFKPGEITPEEANRVGYETAMRWTKGKHAFFVATHTDRRHIHNHIYYNSTALDCAHKYRDFFRSASALRRLSDRVCLENDLSVITNPKLHSKGRFLHYGQWIGERPPSAQQRLRLAIGDALAKKPADFEAFLWLMEGAGYAVKHGRGGVISFLVPGQKKPTRLRASTLGDGYDPEDIRAVIAGERPTPEIPDEAPPPQRINLIIDIQERLSQGKGPAYERWAKVYNLKQMAAALQYLREHELGDYYRYRFGVLRKLGVEESEIDRLVLKQLAVWFGLPIVVAILISLVVIFYFFQMISVQISAYLGFGALMAQVGIIVGILILLLLCYFISTWILFKRSISEN